jgi:hypothetical protein
MVEVREFDPTCSNPTIDPGPVGRLLSIHGYLTAISAISVADVLIGLQCEYSDNSKVNYCTKEAGTARLFSQIEIKFRRFAFLPGDYVIKVDLHVRADDTVQQIDFHTHFGLFYSTAPVFFDPENDNIQTRSKNNNEYNTNRCKNDSISFRNLEYSKSNGITLHRYFHLDKYGNHFALHSFSFFRPIKSSDYTFSSQIRSLFSPIGSPPFLGIMLAYRFSTLLFFRDIIPLIEEGTAPTPPSIPTHNPTHSNQPNPRNQRLYLQMVNQTLSELTLSALISPKSNLNSFSLPPSHHDGDNMSLFHPGTRDQFPSQPLFKDRHFQTSGSNIPSFSLPKAFDDDPISKLDQNDPLKWVGTFKDNEGRKTSLLYDGDNSEFFKLSSFSDIVLPLKTIVRPNIRLISLNMLPIRKKNIMERPTQLFFLNDFFRVEKCYSGRDNVPFLEKEKDLDGKHNDENGVPCAGGSAAEMLSQHGRLIPQYVSITLDNSYLSHNHGAEMVKGSKGYILNRSAFWRLAENEKPEKKNQNRLRDFWTEWSAEDKNKKLIEGMRLALDSSSLKGEFCQDKVRMQLDYYIPSTAIFTTNRMRAMYGDVKEVWEGLCEKYKTKKDRNDGDAKNKKNPAKIILGAGNVGKYCFRHNQTIYSSNPNHINTPKDGSPQAVLPITRTSRRPKFYEVEELSDGENHGENLKNNPIEETKNEEKKPQFDPNKISFLTNNNPKEASDYFTRNPRLDNTQYLRPVGLNLHFQEFTPSSNQSDFQFDKNDNNIAKKVEQNTKNYIDKISSSLLYSIPALPDYDCITNNFDDFEDTRFEYSIKHPKNNENNSKNNPQKNSPQKLDTTFEELIPLPEFDKNQTNNLISSQYRSPAEHLCGFVLWESHSRDLNGIQLIYGQSTLANIRPLSFDEKTEDSFFLSKIYGTDLGLCRILFFDPALQFGGFSGFYKPKPKVINSLEVSLFPRLQTLPYRHCRGYLQLSQHFISYWSICKAFFPDLYRRFEWLSFFARKLEQNQFIEHSNGNKKVNIEGSEILYRPNDVILQFDQNQDGIYEGLEILPKIVYKKYFLGMQKSPPKIPPLGFENNLKTCLPFSIISIEENGVVEDKSLKNHSIKRRALIFDPTPGVEFLEKEEDEGDDDKDHEDDDKEEIGQKNEDKNSHQNNNPSPNSPPNTNNTSSPEPEFPFRPPPAGSIADSYLKKYKLSPEQLFSHLLFTPPKFIHLNLKNEKYIRISVDYLAWLKMSPFGPSHVITAVNDEENGGGVRYIEFIYPNSPPQRFGALPDHFERTSNKHNETTSTKHNQNDGEIFDLNNSKNNQNQIKTKKHLFTLISTNYFHALSGAILYYRPNPEYISIIGALDGNDFNDWAKKNATFSPPDFVSPWILCGVRWISQPLCAPRAYSQSHNTNATLMPHYTNKETLFAHFALDFNHNGDQHDQWGYLNDPSTKKISHLYGIQTDYHTTSFLRVPYQTNSPGKSSNNGVENCATGDPANSTEENIPPPPPSSPPPRLLPLDNIFEVMPPLPSSPPLSAPPPVSVPQPYPTFSAPRYLPSTIISALAVVSAKRLEHIEFIFAPLPVLPLSSTIPTSLYGNVRSPKQLKLAFKTEIDKMMLADINTQKNAENLAYNMSVDEPRVEWLLPIESKEEEMERMAGEIGKERNLSGSDRIMHVKIPQTLIHQGSQWDLYYRNAALAHGK